MTSTTNDYFTNNNQKINKNSVNGFKYTMDQDSLSQDLHFKMSKKIAQLTKVIYALNTKNDDSEMTINVLKLQHHKEIQQILDDTNQKVVLLDEKLKNHLIDNQKIGEMQANIKLYENLLDETKQKFEIYQKENNQLNAEKDIKYLEQLECLKDQIKLLKISYDQLTEDYYNLDKNIEIEKNAEINILKSNYDKEIENIKEEFKNKEQNLQSMMSGNETEIQNQLSKAEQEIQLVINSKDQMVKDHGTQILKLEHLLQSQCKESSETIRTMELEIEEYKSKYLSLNSKIKEKERFADDHINSFTEQLTEKSNLIVELREKIKMYEIDCQEKISIINKNYDEIGNQKKYIQKLESEMKSKVEEMVKIQKINDEWNQNMALKLKQMKELKNSLDNVQQKLVEKENELKTANNKIQWMNEESKEMENCSKSVTTDYEIQIQTLQRCLEELRQERISDKSLIERMKFNHNMELLESISNVKKEYESETEKINKKRDKDISIKEKSNQEEIQKLKDENQIRLEEERSKASKIIEKLKVDSDQVKSDFNSKMKSKEKQISTIEENLLNKEKEWKNVTTQLKEAKENIISMKKDNQKLSKNISEMEKELNNSKNEIEKLKLLLEEQKSLNDKIKKNVQIQEDMSEKYNKLSAELDSKWADTLRRETGRLRNDLTDNFAKEKQKIIDKMENDKNELIKSIKTKYKNKKLSLRNNLSIQESEVKRLENEINQLKSSNDSQTMTKMEEIQSMLTECQQIHATEIANLNKSHKISMQNYKQQFDKEKSQYIQEMQMNIETQEKSWKDKYTNSINSINIEHEKTMKIKMDELENKHIRQINNQLQEMQSEMSDKSRTTIDEHKEEIKSLYKRITLLEDQLKELNNQNRIEIERLTSGKSKLEIVNKKIEIQLQDTMIDNIYLKKQIDDFGDDYNRNQKEFTEKLRKQDIELRRTFEQNAANLKIKYEDEAKQTLMDFNKAQTLFKEKITQLNNKLIEIEEQFINRPSRDEDLDIIQTLKAQLKVSEKEIERLNEEKRFIQLELVNRETNFNKIFNSSPNVGVINPTQGAIKSKKIPNEKMKSFQKLTPLPGSPFHDDPINPTKPLPPSSRKSFDSS